MTNSQLLTGSQVDTAIVTQRVMHVKHCAMFVGNSSMWQDTPDDRHKKCVGHPVEGTQYRSGGGRLSASTDQGAWGGPHPMLAWVDSRGGSADNLGGAFIPKIMRRNPMRRMTNS